MTLHLLLYRFLFRKKNARVRQKSQIVLILRLIYWTRSFWVFSRRTLWFLNSVEPNQVYGVVICFLLTNLGWIRVQMFRFSKFVSGLEVWLVKIVIFGFYPTLLVDSNCDLYFFNTMTNLEQNMQESKLFHFICFIPHRYSSRDMIKTTPYLRPPPPPYITWPNQMVFAYGLIQLYWTVVPVKTILLLFNQFTKDMNLN